MIHIYIHGNNTSEMIKMEVISLISSEKLWKLIVMILTRRYRLLFHYLRLFMLIFIKKKKKTLHDDVNPFGKALPFLAKLTPTILFPGTETIAMLAWELRNGWILNSGPPQKSALMF